MAYRHSGCGGEKREKTFSLKWDVEVTMWVLLIETVCKVVLIEDESGALISLSEGVVKA